MEPLLSTGPRSTSSSRVPPSQIRSFFSSRPTPQSGHSANETTNPIHQNVAARQSLARTNAAASASVSSDATAKATSNAEDPINPSNSVTTLKLTPINIAECLKRFKKKGVDIKEPKYSQKSPALAEHDKLQRNAVLLKLCNDRSKDVLDVNETGITVTRYARWYKDNSVSATALLGRNTTTGIRWLMVSRALCDVSLSRKSATDKKVSIHVESSDGVLEVGQAGEVGNGKSGNPSNSTPAYLTMRKSPGQHGVFIDGSLVEEPLGRQVPLKDGSIVSLYGPTGLAYLIQISYGADEDSSRNNKTSSSFARMLNDGGDSSISPRKRKSPTPPSPHLDQNEQKKPHDPQHNQDENQKEPSKPTLRQELKRRNHQLMVHECTCAMCMDILVKSTFSYPCSHAFCSECADEIKASTDKPQCPTCRGTVTGWMAARSFDTMVWVTAQQGCFERDDAEHYLKRRGECGEDPPTELEKELILNNGGNVDDRSDQGSSNGMQKMAALPLQVTSAVAAAPTMQRALASNNPTLLPNTSMVAVTNAVAASSFGDSGSAEGSSADDAICLD